MNIGLIAHDAKKKLMQNFCIAYRGILTQNELYATGTTGRLIEEVIFLRDPLTAKSNEPDINPIVRACDANNIPLATNLATAELLIKSLDRGDLEWREMYR